MKSVIHLPTSQPAPGHEAAPAAHSGHAGSLDPAAAYAHLAPLSEADEPAPAGAVDRSWPAGQSSNAGLAMQHSPRQHSPFVPLLLGGMALLGWMVFQARQLFTERETLAATHASQQLTVDNAGKLRASLDALAADTQRMAQAGNPNARLLVVELSKRGVTINPSAAPTGAALPGAPTGPNVAR